MALVYIGSFTIMYKLIERYFIRSFENDKKYIQVEYIRTLFIETNYK